MEEVHPKTLVKPKGFPISFFPNYYHESRTKINKTESFVTGGLSRRYLGSS